MVHISVVLVRSWFRFVCGGSREMFGGHFCSLNWGFIIIIILMLGFVILISDVVIFLFRCAGSLLSKLISYCVGL